ncbi:Uncharacterised protein r2_g65 [Pycnogonum litorale]
MRTNDQTKANGPQWWTVGRTCAVEGLHRQTCALTTKRGF